MGRILSNGGFILLKGQDLPGFVQFYNCNGMEIQRPVINGKIIVSDFQPGLYILKFDYHGTVKTTKVAID